MAIENFTLGQLIGPSDLNNSFGQCVQVGTTAQQSLLGPLSAPTITAIIGIQTQDLTVTGNAIFSSASGIQLPVGNTLQRPFNNAPGWLRVNSDSGLLECLLPSGIWVNLQTATAAQNPSIAPTSIASVQFGQASSTAIPLTWSLPVGGTVPFVYTIQYRLSGTSTWINWVTKIVSQSTTISGLLPAARYEFQVIVENAAGSATSPVSATNTLGYLAGGPTSVSSFSPTSTSLSVSWTPVSASVPVAYVVQYAPANVSVWSTFGTAINDTTTTITGLAPNTIYDIQVIARTSGGSFESLVAQGTTSINATVSPNIVTNLSFTSISTSSLSVTWVPPTAGTSPFVYQLQYQLGGSTSWFNYGAATTSTTTNLLNLNSGGIYSFRVTTTNSLGTSTSSPYPVTLLTSANTLGQVTEYQSSGNTYPIIGGPQIGQVATSSALDISGVTLVDPAAGYLPGSLIVSVKCGTGSVSMTDINGNQITGSGTSTISAFAATLSGAQAALESLTYTAASVVSSDSISITVSDQMAQTSNLSISLTVVSQSGSSPSPTPTPPGPVPPAPPGSPPARTKTGQPTDLNGTMANRASSITSNIGVGTNFSSGYYGPDFSPTTAAIIENSINYLNGISFVRDSGLFNYFAEGSFLQQIGQNCGVQFVLEISGGNANSITNNFNAWFNALSQILLFSSSYPGYLLGIQGVNTQGFTNNGTVVDSFSYGQAIQFQTTVLNSAAANGISVIEMELDGNLTNVGQANFGLMQMFPDNIPSGGAFTSTAGGYLADSATDAAIVTPGQNMFVEIGYQSFPDGMNVHQTGSNFVDETTQAKYLLETIIDMFLTPTVIQYEMWYQLYDTPLSSFGLFTGYGGTPKPAGQALAGFLGILQDFTVSQNTFHPGLLNYTVSNKPTQFGSFTSTGYKEILLQLSAGQFILIMCNEQPLNTTGTDSEISVAAQTVTLSFNERVMINVQVLDSIIYGKLGQLAATIASRNNVSSITFQLPAWPIYVVVTHS